MKLNKLIKSPLRYPGGKSRAVPIILPRIPFFKEFREPFLGGGSIFIAIKQFFPKRKYWLNDINKDLFSFWKITQENAQQLAQEILTIKNKYKNGKKLFEHIKNKRTEADIDRAVRFFILNRITFSGTIDSGGYSEMAFQSRFTNSSIDRILKLSPLLENVIITNEDYERSILEPGENVFLFLDPPYYSATKSKLYGKNGNLHTGFDHERFAYTMKKCNHRWLITYDDSLEVRKLFSFARTYQWQLQYGMNNYKQTNAKKGRELLLSNYDILPVNTFKNLQLF